MSPLQPTVLLAALLAFGYPGPATAQSGPADGMSRRDAETGQDELTEQEKREEDARRSCKVAVCAALHNRRPGRDVSCQLVKSWPKEQVERVVSKARAGWPWGDVRCWGAVSLKREMLIKALSEPRYEVVVDRHTVACSVERKKGATEFKFDLAPKVTFQNGKAVEATLNWGRIEGPRVIKLAMWTAAATDNALNLLQGTVLDKVNEFVSTKCDEVRKEWQNK